MRPRGHLREAWRIGSERPGRVPVTADYLAGMVFSFLSAGSAMRFADGGPTWLVFTAAWFGFLAMFAALRWAASAVAPPCDGRES